MWGRETGAVSCTKKLRLGQEPFCFMARDKILKKGRALAPPLPPRRAERSFGIPWPGKPSKPQQVVLMHLTFFAYASGQHGTNQIRNTFVPLHALPGTAPREPQPHDSPQTFHQRRHKRICLGPLVLVQNRIRTRGNLSYDPAEIMPDTAFSNF